jgi:hypothetical protein
MPKLNQKGFAPILLIIILLVGIVGGLYLIKHPLIFRPKAGGGPIYVTDLGGGILPVSSLDIPQTVSPNVKITLLSPLGAPIFSSSPSPSSSVIPSPTSTPISSPIGIGVSVLGVGVTSPNIPASGTVSYKIAENPADLDNAPELPYTQDQMRFNYTFKDKGLGVKFIWVEFKDTTGKTERVSTRIEIIQKRGFGKALNMLFNSSGPQYVSIPVSSSLNAYSNFTVEAWVKPSKPFTFGKRTILGKVKDGAGRAYLLTLDLWPPSNGNVGYSYSFSVADQTLSNCAYREAVQAQAQTSEENMALWQHVAGVVKDGKLSLYVNGQEVNYLPTTSGRSVTSYCNPAIPIQIGSYATTNNNQIFSYIGEIDEIRMSNIARYTSNFTPILNIFSPDSYTLALYHFDGDVDDASGNNHNGEMVGGISFVDSTIVPTSNTIDWKTSQAFLAADNFYIEANGKIFKGDKNIEVHSDPGDSTRTTLESTWNENGVEMRMFTYFSAKDGKWKVDEIRTYDGTKEGKWMYYYPAFPEESIGVPHTEKAFSLYSDRSESGLTGRIVFSSLSIQAFGKLIDSPAPKESPIEETPFPSEKPTDEPSAFPSPSSKNPEPTPVVSLPPARGEQPSPPPVSQNSPTVALDIPSQVQVNQQVLPMGSVSSTRGVNQVWVYVSRDGGSEPIRVQKNDVLNFNENNFKCANTSSNICNWYLVTKAYGSPFSAVFTPRQTGVYKVMVEVEPNTIDAKAHYCSSNPYISYPFTNGGITYYQCGEAATITVN